MTEEPDAQATVTRATPKASRPTVEPVRLRAVHPPSIPWSTALAPGAVVIGRTTATEGAPALPHPTVSRRHYEVTWDARTAHPVGRDLESHNGTRIDGVQAAGPHPLHDGSVVQLGDVSLVVERGEPGDTLAPEATAILGVSPAAGRLRAAIVRAAPDPSPVLLVAIEAGSFRRDLYARLSLWEIPVAPLRERRGDVLAWMTTLHEAFCARRPEHAGTPLRLAPDAVEALLLHPWTGNLRELDRVVHELSAAPSSAAISRADLPAFVTAPARAPHAARAPSADPTPETPDKRAIPTREEFVAVFDALEGNVRAMAKHFDRDRRQIYRWIDGWGLADRRPARRGPSKS